MLKSNRQNHLRIKHKLERRGISFTQIAKSLGIKPVSVTSVSQGYSRSRRVENEIARLLECTPAELWPERYEEELETSK